MRRGIATVYRRIGRSGSQAVRAAPAKEGGIFQMSRYEMRDVVVLLPGITGSVLRKNGKVVWGYSAGTIGRTLATLGDSLERDLALPDDDPDIDDLGDGIVADALMPDLHLLPGLWKIDGYGKIVKAITSSFEVTEGKNFFQFPYDWRRHNRVAARKLAREAGLWLDAWRYSSGNADAKLILVAHSMGGLVSRYYLECLDGWRNTRALVSFGTPYQGSPDALDTLANGMTWGPLDLSALARQMTSIYQLLPVYPCYDAGDGRLVRVGETAGIPKVDAAKAAAALAFHREIEAAVESHKKDQKYLDARYRIYPVVGIGQRTNLSARSKNGKVEMLQTFEGKSLFGDGTVPRVAAIPIELGQNPMAAYAGTKHGSLQNTDHVILNLTGFLTGTSIDLGAFRGTIRVALDVEDLTFDREPVTVRARPVSDVPLTATFWSGTTRLAEHTMRPAGDEWQEAVFQPPGAGAYRVTIDGEDVETAEDAFAVIERGGP
jgi:pimeloyl-ACP methyl ester carboxylesterase